MTTQFPSRLGLALALAATMAAIPALAKTSGSDFASKVAVASQFEIDSSRLALARATSPEVKQFAQKMIDDHTAASDKMKAAMAKDNIDSATLPAVMDDKHQKIFDKLRDADLKKFDEAYMDAQEEAHAEAVSLFKDFADDGDAPALKAFAAETLPTLQSHEDHAKKLESKVD